MISAAKSRDNGNIHRRTEGDFMKALIYAGDKIFFENRNQYNVITRSYYLAAKVYEVFDFKETGIFDT